MEIDHELEKRLILLDIYPGTAHVQFLYED